MYRRMHIIAVLQMLCLTVVCAIASAETPGRLQHYPLDAESTQQWRLPGKLTEISGLALTADDRLLAVDDEVGIVYEMDFTKGGIVKAFALGKPAVRADFEGIAVAAGLVYLVTSDGSVYLASEGADGQRVSYDIFSTNAGESCEIEGLAGSVDGSRLYLLCKNLYDGASVTRLAIFVWSVDEQRLLPDEVVLLPTREIRRELRTGNFQPSGLTVDAASGNFIVVAAKQRAVAEISASGALVHARKLPLVARHRQPEGIELTSDGRLLIADEGGTHKARLAVYRQEENE